MHKMDNLNLLKKLCIVQGEVDKFIKDGSGYGYKYTKGSTVLDKLRPAWHSQGLLLQQEIVETKSQIVKYTTLLKKEKTEVLTEAKFKFTWIDSETGEFLESLWESNGMNDFEKGIGSAATYAERYFLMKFFHIHSDEDDPDGKLPDDPNGNPKKTAKRKAMEQFVQSNEKQFSKMISACLKKYSKDSYRDLSDEELEKLKTAISNEKSKKEEK